VAPLTEDGNLDVAGLWSGGVDLWKGVPSGGTFVYSPVGTLSLSSVILSALELQDADGDGDRDVTVVENDLFANPPVVTVRLLSNTGTGTLGPSRFSSTSFPLSGRSYVSSWSWGDRCDCDIDSYRSFRSAYYSDPGFTSLRASARFEDGSFTGGFPDHEVSSSTCDDVVTFAWDLDGLDDTAFVDQATSTLEVHRAVAFPVDDEYGTGCGSSTLSSEGTLDLGDGWTLRVDTEQGRPTVLLLATSPTDATISPGCALRVGPSLLCTPVTFSSPSGVARFTIDVPDDVSILSQEVCAQAAVVKPGGAHAGVLDVTSARRGKVGDCQ
jgi:hypothetical protein